MVYHHLIDKDKYKRWWYWYLLENLGQQWNPYEWMKITTQLANPVALSRGYQTFTSFAKFMISSGQYVLGDKENALDNRGKLKGWNTLRKGIPLISSYSDFVKRLEEGESVEWLYYFSKYR